MASGAFAICPVSTTAVIGWPATMATRSVGEFTEINSHVSGLKSSAVSLNADADWRITGGTCNDYFGLGHPVISSEIRVL